MSIEHHYKRVCDELAATKEKLDMLIQASLHMDQTIDRHPYPIMAGEPYHYAQAKLKEALRFAGVIVT